LRIGSFEGGPIPSGQRRANFVGAAIEVQDQLIWVGGQSDLLVRKDELRQLGVEKGGVGADRRRAAAGRLWIHVGDERWLRELVIAWPEAGQGSRVASAPDGHLIG